MMCWRLRMCLLFFCASARCFEPALAFEARVIIRSLRSPRKLLCRSCVCALGKAHSKQAELLRKMELARQQHRPITENTNPSQSQTTPDKNEHSNNAKGVGQSRLEQEQAEFAALLTKFAPPPEPKERGTIRSDVTTTNEATGSTLPKLSLAPTKPAGRRRRKKATNAQSEDANEEEEFLNEGDVAKRRHFESLVCTESKHPLGPTGSAQLVPWVPPFLSQYLIILADPRKRSSELRSAVQYITTEIGAMQAPNIIAISTDSPEEVSAWLRRNDRTESRYIRVFSDVNLEWMKLYSTDQGRWSLTLYLIDSDGLIRKLLREVDTAMAVRLVSEWKQQFSEE